MAERIETVMCEILDEQERSSSPAISAKLMTAIRYSSLSGGKRIRGALVLAAAMTGPQALHCRSAAESIASAVEFTHAYSLIHDDLPAMDNDSLRRGKATCHIAFGEGLAILAGDALQVLAYEVLANTKTLSPQQRCHNIALLAAASGPAGMAGGQATDLLTTGHRLSIPELTEMYNAKTTALLRAATLMGAVCAGAAPATMKALDEFATHIGLAFQIRDDLLDIYGDSKKMGKTTGSDQNAHKHSYPTISGIEQAQQLLQSLYRSAIKSLTELDKPATELQMLAKYIVERDS